MSNQKEKPVSQKSPLALREEEILRFWKSNHIFQKSVDHPASLPTGSAKGEFVFYDGPPFATGTPHYGHILAGTIKDAIPRYKTMQGYQVRRRWGWDCHGLPVENIVEKELGLASKKDIYAYGIEKFNAASRKTVMRYADEWRRLVPRFGRFVDMEDDYETMDPSYTESVWWAFKKLHDKGLIYEGFKSMQLCPRCETTLSNFEVNQGYRDITDISIYVKFKLTDKRFPNAYLIAWTTTPWTLPGNVALAINPAENYGEYKLEGAGESGVADNATYFVAEKLAGTVFREKKAVKIKTWEGKNLIGLSYEPLFDYYSSDPKLENRNNGWKIYAGDFVTVEDGTGIVHIAPAFGEDDMNLGKAQKLPFIQHVGTDGKFKKEVKDFAGLDVKPKDTPDDKDAHQRGDIEIIKYLAHHGAGDGAALFEKKKIIHSYAHCWRCDTPLLNYASSSWFVRVTDFRDKLAAINKKIKWVPSEVGQGRFGNWLENARDWAISRSRFWGAPLPVWKDEKTGDIEVLGSVADLRARSHSKNTYFVMRHGEAENNVKGIVSSVASVKHGLTEKGKQQAERTGISLKGQGNGDKIDLIFVSPFVRTRETASIVGNLLGVKESHIIVDERLREINGGIFNNKPVSEFHAFFGKEDRFKKAPTDGENFNQIRQRMGDFIYDIEGKYSGKNVLIVTHDTPAWLLFAAANGLDENEANALRGTSEFFILNAQFKKLDFHPLPHNAFYELDLHRPFIDDVVLTSRVGNRLVRVPEVFDCWFESGSMPFGEAHYPFEQKVGENKAEFNPHAGFFASLLAKISGTPALGARGKGFPANFIAEGLDQTRGWFYSMLVLGVALFGKSPYEQVIVNGIILAEDGQKMSKSKANYPDPMTVVDKYGADAVRYYMLSSPVVRGQDFCFSEKGVDEVVKKHIGRLNNVLAFYEMYAGGEGTGKGGDASGDSAYTSKNVLDQWILARLSELVVAVTQGMDDYELDRATRPFADFIDDLSTWYLRRSRDRFKSDASSVETTDKKAALATIHHVLMTTAQLLAPFMPFLAEDMYQRLMKTAPSMHAPKSIHLTAWPLVGTTSYRGTKDILQLMSEVRRIASLGLEARSKAKINVRQPLASLAVRRDGDKLVGEGMLETMLGEHSDLLALIKDEVNVKEITWKNELSSTATADAKVEIDTVLTPQLREEGNVRDIVRIIQDFRKTSALTISDVVTLNIATDEAGKALIEKNQQEIMRTTGLKAITFSAKVGEQQYALSIVR